MRFKCFSIILVCLLMGLFTSCYASTEVSSSFEETSVSPSSFFSEASTGESEPEEAKSGSEAASTSAETGRSVFELFDGFPMYDLSSELSYEEYFSEERYLEKAAFSFSEGVPSGYPPDMPGYQYIKGDSSEESDWETASWYWTAPFDNLYLLHLDTGERTPLAEVEEITRLMVFPDRLYLVTEYAVWRCGRLGEDLTCVYEHPSRIYASEWCESSEVLFFETLETKPAEIWRLHMPSGTADRLCNVQALDRFATGGDGHTYIPVTNEAFLYRRAGDSRGEWYVYSARTGQCTQLDADKGEEGVEIDMSVRYDWFRENYELERY